MHSKPVCFCYPKIMSSSAQIAQPTAPAAGAAQTSFALNVAAPILAPTQQRPIGAVYKYVDVPHFMSMSKKPGDKKVTTFFGTLATVMVDSLKQPIVIGKGNVWLKKLIVDFIPISTGGRVGMCFTGNTTNFDDIDAMFQAPNSQIFIFGPAKVGVPIQFELVLNPGLSEQISPPSGFYPMPNLAIIVEGDSTQFLAKFSFFYDCTVMTSFGSLN